METDATRLATKIVSVSTSKTCQRIAICLDSSIAIYDFETNKETGNISVQKIYIRFRNPKLKEKVRIIQQPDGQISKLLWTRPSVSKSYRKFGVL